MQRSQPSESRTTYVSLVLGCVLAAIAGGSASGDDAPQVESRTWDAETLKVSFASPGVTRTEQDMSTQGPGWSNSKQLDVRFQNLGDAVEFTVPAVAGRPHRLLLMVSNSPDGGVFEIQLNRQSTYRTGQLSIATSAEGVSPPIPIDLGVHFPAGDSFSLRMILGPSLSNDQPLRTHCGLDTVVVEPYDLGAERAIAEYVLDNRGSVTIEQPPAAGGGFVGSAFIRDKSALPADNWILSGVSLNSLADPDVAAEKCSQSLSLTEVSLISRTAISAKTLSAIASMKTLSRLRLALGPNDDAALKPLSGHSRLSNLAINGRSLSDEAMESISELPFLETLSIDASALTNVGVKHLSRCSRLRFVMANDVTDQIVENIANLSQLQSLSLNTRGPVSDQFLEPLQRMPKLGQLMVRSDTLTDAGCLALENQKTIRSLTLTTAAVTPEVIERLKVVLPECQVSVSRGSPFTSRARTVAGRGRIGQPLPGQGDPVVLPNVASKSIECESIVTAISIIGQTTTSVQEKQGQGWSGDRQLSVQFTQADDRLLLTFPVIPGRPYRLSLVPTASPDGGLVKFQLSQTSGQSNRFSRNDTAPSAVAVDLHGDKVAPMSPIDFGVQIPEGDRTTLIVSAAGLASKPATFPVNCGLDFVRIEPYDTAPELAIMERVLAVGGSVSTLRPASARAAADLLTLTGNLDQLPPENWVLRRVTLPAKLDLESLAELLGQSKSLVAIEAPEATVSDKALDQLQKLTQLESLSLVNSKLTPAQQERLKQALPKCFVTTEAPQVAGRGTGRSGFGVEPTLSRELRNEMFASKLKITEQQQQLLNNLDMQRREYFRSIPRGGGTPGEEFEKQMQDMRTKMKEFEDKSIEILTPDQKIIWEERKAEIKKEQTAREFSRPAAPAATPPELQAVPPGPIPRVGRGGLGTEPTVSRELRNETFAAKLKITDPQQQLLNNLEIQRMEYFRSLPRGGSAGAPGSEEFEKRLKEIQAKMKDFEDKSVEILTPDQKIIWEERKAEIKKEQTARGSNSR